MFVEWENLELPTNDDGGVHGQQHLNDYRLRRVQALSQNAQMEMIGMRQGITTAMWANHGVVHG